ncbi:hypothetical protein DFJ74DRAFT_343782 [Hyaloraphidium curvatum]|nr:hypothetical protein DFJ74DRAFT_343782 [Hyaloraphidium curvatum]
MGWTEKQIPDLKGHTILVTGANQGLGRVTALELARANARVLMAVRNTEGGQVAADEIARATGNKAVEVRQLDLMSLENVEAFCRKLKEGADKVDGIVLNAGIMAIPSLKPSADNIESQFATNVVGHTLLLLRLLPSVIRNADEKKLPARVVWVSSDLHNKADPKIGVDFSTVNDASKYKPWVWYGETKLCNLLLSNYMTSLLPASKYPNLYINACHPGFVATELARNVTGMSFLGPAKTFFLRMAGAGKVENGARPQTYLASATTGRGEYWGPNKSSWEAEKQTTSPFGSDKGLQKKAWEWTLAVLKEKGHSVDAELAELGISA